MADYTVEVVNREVDVYDTTNGAILEEIRDLLKQILARLPEQRSTEP